MAAYPDEPLVATITESGGPPVRESAILFLISTRRMLHVGFATIDFRTIDFFACARVFETTPLPAVVTSVLARYAVW